MRRIDESDSTKDGAVRQLRRDINSFSSKRASGKDVVEAVKSNLSDILYSLEPSNIDTLLLPTKQIIELANDYSDLPNNELTDWVSSNAKLVQRYIEGNGSKEYYRTIKASLANDYYAIMEDLVRELKDIEIDY